MILTLIAICEIGFWVVIAAGLTIRYLLRRPRAGLALLALVPVIDVVLLAATALDLRSGGTAGVGHAVAAIYLGFSLTYGRRLVHWADVRFAHRFAGGAAPVRLTGWAHARQCWGDVRRTFLAGVIACGLTWGLVAWVDDPSRTRELGTNYRWMGWVFALEVLFATSYTIWPRRPEPRRETRPTGQSTKTQNSLPSGSAMTVQRSVG